MNVPSCWAVHSPPVAYLSLDLSTPHTRQAFIPRCLDEVAHYERDQQRVLQAGTGNVEGIYYQTITGLRDDLSGARTAPSFLLPATTTGVNEAEAAVGRGGGGSESPSHVDASTPLRPRAQSKVEAMGGSIGGGSLTQHKAKAARLADRDGGDAATGHPLLAPPTDSLMVSSGDDDNEDGDSSSGGGEEEEGDDFEANASGQDREALRAARKVGSL